jgi:hypothetical protein
MESMHRRAQAGRSITIRMTAALAIAGCSSGTEAAGPDGPAHLTSTVTVSSAAIPVGAEITAQWTIENTGSVPLHHAFGNSNLVGYGLEISVTPAFTVLSSENADILLSPNDSLNLGPHGKVRLGAILKAVAIGTAKVTGCLPADSGQVDGANCTSADVRVVSGL